MRTLKMIWNSGTKPLACRWVESIGSEGSEEVLTRLRLCGPSGGPGEQSLAPQSPRLDWNVFFNFRQPAFPPSFETYELLTLRSS